MTPTEKQDLRKVYTVPEAAAILGIGRNLAYSGVHEGWLPAIRCGRRLVVPRQALDAMLANPASYPARPAPPDSADTSTHGRFRLHRSQP